MTDRSDSLAYRRLRVPTADHAALIDPPSEAMPSRIAENLRLRRQQDCDLQGRSLAELACQARRELVVEARRWTSTYRDAPSAQDDAERPIFMAGHQPQLVHPGVWFKNFVLDRLARQHGATAVNLLVDGDTVKETTLRVPGGSVDQPRVADVALDAPGRGMSAQAVPYEEYRVVDRACFESFGRRAAEHIRSLVPEAMVEDFWSIAVARLGENDHLGECLAQSRHVIEGRWGLETFELPASQLCRGEPFAWFVAHLLAQCRRFQQTHNAILDEYRRGHRIRNAAWPVPDLAADGPWLEAPFWIWTSADPRRRAVWVRRRADRVELGDRESIGVELPLREDGSAQPAVARLMDLAAEGVKIRCRTLTTTLFARLMLADVFLHGVGGAKYDQVTDALVERFFGLRPLSFFTVSATLRLPIPRPAVTLEDEQTLAQRLRDLEFHPEKCLDDVDIPPDGPLAALLAEKSRWLHTPRTPGNAKQWDEELRRINAAFQPWVDAQRRRLLALARRSAETGRAEAILNARDYAACLYPEQTIRQGLQDLAGS